MANSEKTYGYFYKMLSYVIAQRGHGAQIVLAIDTGVSEAHISQIISGKGRASFDLQVAIARALGYGYPDFLEQGRRLVEGEPGKIIPAVREPPAGYEHRPIVKNILKLLDGLDESDLREIKKMVSDKAKLRKCEMEIAASKKRKRENDPDLKHVSKRRYPL